MTLAFHDAWIGEEPLRRLQHIFQGNRDAIRICSLLRNITHVWDDLIDKDKEVTPAMINGAFWAAVVELPTIPLWQKLAPVLVPVLKNGILGWFAANELERDTSNPLAREVSHVCRFDVGDFVLLLAEAIGGPAWAAQHAAELKLIVRDEPFSEYVRGLEGGDQ